uniref:Uncharacterized protein n=1 Tax=Emiliania huxleyi (strain CCMP1516) TaxID=280463 RepID=A0A0D3I0I5_EMIH1
MYWEGPSHSFENGDTIVHGQQGEVVGPATGAHQGNGLEVQFPGNKGSINCYLPQLSVEKPPPLPGGHDLGDQLYYTGPSHSFESGDELVHGQQGEVVGPATEGTRQGNGLVMLFPGNKGHVNCYLSRLSVEKPPPLPGGHDLGDQLYYTGSSHSFESGDKLVHGQQGEVVGPATGAHQGNGLEVRFPGNIGSINCSLPNLSREQPPPLPGGHEAGDQLYYTGPNKSFKSGNRLVHGQSGEVVGPATEGTHQGNGLQLLFPGNKGFINCSLTWLSREQAPPLPGGFRVGEELYFIGGGFVDEQGDKAVFGCRGSVTGPARNGDADAVSMSFSGNRGDVHCRAQELSREPAPSLPGGFILGEHLYFTGESPIIKRRLPRTDFELELDILVRGSR